MNTSLSTRRDFLRNAAVSTAAGWVAGKTASSRAAGDALSHQPAFERISRDRVLRCGYAPYPLYFLKDPNTGKFSGIFYEMIEAMAKILNLKTEYPIETTYGTFVEDLKQGRFDVMVSDVWASGARALAADFTTPCSYTVLQAYVRAGDTRFDHQLEKLNSKETRLATMDGEMTSMIAQEDFPQARTVALPNTAEFTLLMENVVSGKADATFWEPAVARQWLEKHPGSIRPVAPGKPVRVFGNVFAVAKGEIRLRDTLDAAVQQLVHSGAFDRIAAKYTQPGDYYPVAAPYQPAALVARQ